MNVDPAMDGSQNWVGIRLLQSTAKLHNDTVRAEVVCTLGLMWEWPRQSSQLRRGSGRNWDGPVRRADDWEGVGWSGVRFGQGLGLLL